jgi:hypothetical protein
VDDADEVANGTHDDEAETDGLAEFGEFALRGCIRRLGLEMLVLDTLVPTLVMRRDVRFWQRFMNCVPSLMNSRGISAKSWRGCG